MVPLQEMWYAGWTVVVMARKERALQAMGVINHVSVYLRDLQAVL